MVNPHSFAQFRPILLCNTIYKIFTRAILRRIALLIPKVVSDEQQGLVPSRETLEGGILSHKVLHCVMTDRVSSMVLKLDMMKFCDSVDWGFWLTFLRNLISLQNGSNGCLLVFPLSGSQFFLMGLHVAFLSPLGV